MSTWRGPTWGFKHAVQIILIQKSQLLQTFDIFNSLINWNVIEIVIIQVLESHNLTPIKLGAKEGLAMINGTQLITSIGAEAVERAGVIARQADVVAALTLEVLKGSSRAFDAGWFALLFSTN